SKTSGDGAPPNTTTIDSAQIVTDTQNSALELKAAEGASGQTDVTLTVRDAQGHTFTQTFHVNITPATSNGGPFLQPIAPIRAVAGQPIQFQVQPTDVEGGPKLFEAFKPTLQKGGYNETTAYTFTPGGDATTANTSGQISITPPTGFVGTFKILVGVTGNIPANQPGIGN